MKTITKYFPLTTFIKNVQSATRKVGKFALNNIEYVLLGIGIVAKVCEAFFSNFNMPLSFYTDTALDMFLVWKGIKNLTADTDYYAKIYIYARTRRATLSGLFDSLSVNFSPSGLAGEANSSGITLSWNTSTSSAVTV